jgi:hypothetical protein
MVGALYQKVLTLLKPTQSKHAGMLLPDSPDPETCCTQNCQLYSGLERTDVQEALSTLLAGIGSDDWQKHVRAGLAHKQYEQQDLDELYTPQQRAFAFMTLHNAEEA